MGELADRLLGMVVTATSPDGQIGARVSGQGRTVEVSFRPGAYRRYREDALAHQLGQLATLTFTRYRRQEDELVAAAFGGTAHEAGRDGYQERLRHLVASAAGDGIEITSRGLASWQVSIGTGLLRRLPEAEFVTALADAVGRLLNRYNAHVLRLKDEVFGLGYPERLRQVAGLNRRGGPAGTVR
jgi:hypothetical protein